VRRANASWAGAYLVARTKTAPRPSGIRLAPIIRYAARDELLVRNSATTSGAAAVRLITRCAMIGCNKMERTNEATNPTFQSPCDSRRPEWAPSTAHLPRS